MLLGRRVGAEGRGAFFRGGWNVTSHDLYAIYAGAYAESSHFESRPALEVPRGLGTRLNRMLSLARTIEELARHDATNGTPMRTRSDFERTLQDGHRALFGMELLAGAGT
jgi:hypothetical protein